MNLVEVNRLTAFVSQVKPAQKIDEFTPDAWHLVIGHLPYDDAFAAVRVLAGEKTWIDPSDIIGKVRAMRRERLESADPAALIPDADPDRPREYVRALREGRHRAADGLHRRDVGALIGGVAKALPAVPDSR